ncbi:MAG: alanine racemase [Clostridiaceae bacterium]|nr:alanine racemase [Clostridiaceae bacterium]
MNHNLLNRSWAEVNLDHIAANVRRIRRSVHRSCEIMGVVKADAYGHGVDQVAPVLLANGASRLAVSMLDEAIELRRSGIAAPILVLGYTDPSRAREILANRITQTVYSRDLAQALSAAAVDMACDARIHIKVDTGMGRVGFLAGYQAIKEITWIRSLPHVIIEGMYTHFATADEADTSYTWKQFEQFMSISDELNRIGLAIPIKHVCNSAATMRFPNMHLDMVRPGLILYGMVPAGCPDAWTDLKPAMTLKTCIVLNKQLPAGSSVSYGRLFTTNRDSQIATIPIGYADGYSRRLSNQASVLVHGQRAPVVGRICMDTCMIDLTQLKGSPVQVGDEVVLFGEQSTDEAAGCIPVDEMAGWLETISYEVTCLIGRRVPRAYLAGDTINAVQSYLLGKERVH